MKGSGLAIFLACAATAAHAQSPLAAIDSCIVRLDATLDVGYEKIAARCPRLASRLEQSGWAAWLPRGWKEGRNDLSAGSLAELRTLVARELEVSRGARRPSVEHLNEVLAGLGPAAQERSSLWSRFRAWLRTVVDRNRAADDRSWLDKMIQRNGRSQTIIDLLTYAALALIVVLAGVIVVNEMRAAGLLRSRARASADSLPADPTHRARVSWQDIERAVRAEKPRLLLELVIARLTDLKRIPPAGALTVRELAHSAALTDAADRERLSQVARTAERARFAPGELAPQVVEQTLEHGRELLLRLQEGT